MRRDARLLQDERTGRRHDLILLRTADPREQELPAAGLVELEDAETGAPFLLDTSSRAVREAFAASARKRRDELKQWAASARIDLVEVPTDGSHLDSLVRFFQLRERRLKRGH